MWVWILSQVGFILVAIVTAPHERVNVASVSAVLGTNLLLLLYVAHLARRVRTGQSFGRALSVLAAFCFIWVVAGAVILGGAMSAPPRPVLVALVVLMASLAAAVVLLIRAMRR